MHRNLAAVVCLILASCFAKTALPADPGIKSGIDLANFDHSVKPGQNFYLYVNGTWIKNNDIPAEYSRWGAFPQLRDRNLLLLRELLDDLSKSNALNDET